VKTSSSYANLLVELYESRGDRTSTEQPAWVMKFRSGTLWHAGRKLRVAAAHIIPLCLRMPVMEHIFEAFTASSFKTIIEK